MTNNNGVMGKEHLKRWDTAMAEMIIQAERVEKLFQRTKNTKLAEIQPRHFWHRQKVIRHFNRQKLQDESDILYTGYKIYYGGEADNTVKVSFWSKVKHLLEQFIP